LDPFFWWFSGSVFLPVFAVSFLLEICVKISSLLIATGWLGSFSVGVLLLIMIVGCFSGKDWGFSFTSLISS
jgi:hypothetical protein